MKTIKFIHHQVWPVHKQWMLAVQASNFRWWVSLSILIQCLLQIVKWWNSWWAIDILHSKMINNLWLLKCTITNNSSSFCNSNLVGANLSTKTMITRIKEWYKLNTITSRWWISMSSMETRTSTKHSSSLYKTHKWVQSTKFLDNPTSNLWIRFFKWVKNSLLDNVSR